MDSPHIEALLFDLGGVVIEIDFGRVFQVWQGLSRLSLDDIRRRFKMDAAYRRHERGEIGASEYFAHLRATLGLEGSDEEIALGWNRIFGNEIPETVKCIQLARRGLPCYAFTNSNPIHRAAWTVAYPNAIAAFERIFVSSELGLRKPERAAFDAVARAIGADPSTILFFDDTLENVQGARAAGMHAVLVREPADVEEALQNINAIRD